MEYATRIISPTEEQLVNIADMQQIGEVEARTYIYACPDEDCRIRVYPAFPRETKSGRIKAQRPYFSAKSESHVEGCRRDGVLILDDKIRERLRTEVVTPGVEALLEI
jgi:hypothetical protein